jgi:aspartyl-tRNA(Asn)/glutamyl-tRNA(Gln) amidotransferase subunit A
MIADMHAGKSSARTLVEQSLSTVESIKDYNAILNLTAERALRRADEIDAARAEGKTLGRLAGVPFVVKDNFLAFGAPTTAASKMLEHYNAPLQATAVEKLEAEGAICIGKANLDAFAHGGSTENSAFGVTKNAHDTSRVAGGSSGGSAVVTALDVVPFALGTDTGGSIRQPASYNGVYGMKPTYGTVSRFGVVAMASGTDTIGCFATAADDVDLIMDILAGQDQQDMTTLPDFYTSVQKAPGKLRIGIVREMMTGDVQPEVRDAVEAYAQQLTEAGHTVETVDLPMAKHALAMYYVIVPAEVSSNLARYDGVRYGLRAEGVKTLAELYGKSRDQGFVTENKRRIMIGSFVLSSGYYDAYYNQAQKARTLLIEAYNELFRSHDVLLSPTAPSTAFEIGKNVEDPIQMYLADVMTVPASLAGLPALNVPYGKDDAGLPIGVQLTGPMRSDSTLIALAKSMEESNV